MEEVPAFKILVLGDNSVGKTCLLNRYTQDVFFNADVTIGVNYSTMSLEIESGILVKLEMWDTAGIEAFRSIVALHVPGKHGFLLVFDLTRPDTFENIKKSWWFSLVPEGSQCLLVGMKCDYDDRVVSREEAELLAEELNMPYLEASAKTGHNVKEVFQMLVRQIYTAKQTEKAMVEQKDKSGASCVLS